MTHPLTTYLNKQGKGAREALCERAGIARMTLWRVERGAAEASTKLLRKVSEATDGEVTVEELAAAFIGQIEATKSEGQSREPVAN